jgi:rubrerythrin
VSNPIAFGSATDLLAHAKAMETEALERYLDLAEQMEVHHNPEVAELFRKMARVERIHVEKILERVGDQDLPHIPPWEYKWSDDEAPESITVEDAHYLMTPHHALTLALRAERRAFDFYSRVVETAGPGEVLELARELMEEEREHIALIEEWLAKVPEPDDDWAEDPDPPLLQE